MPMQFHLERSCHAVSVSHSEALENEVIEEFEKDEMNIPSLKEKVGCGLDLTILVSVKSCNKCDFETHVKEDSEITNKQCIK